MTISSICPSALITYMYCKVIWCLSGDCTSGNCLCEIMILKSKNKFSHISAKKIFIHLLFFTVHTYRISADIWLLYTCDWFNWRGGIFFNLLKFWWLFLFPTFCVHVVIRISKYQWQFLLVQNYFTGFFWSFQCYLRVKVINVGGVTYLTCPIFW